MYFRILSLKFFTVTDTVPGTATDTVPVRDRVTVRDTAPFTDAVTVRDTDMATGTTLILGVK